VLPSLPVVVVGYEDVVLEAEAELAGAFYIVTTDGEEVAAAVQQAILAKRPQRRWHRKRLGHGVSGLIRGFDVRIVDVSYGGFRAEVRNADLGLVTRALELHVPEFEVSADADPIWTMTGTASPVYVCGAAVSEKHEEDGSRWRHFVDLVHAAV